jgi:murein DD-endopeptidase MepM/ murein hydrolase activator NlpD
VRVVLAIAGVVLFGAVAVAASGAGARRAPAPAAPRHTAIPAAEAAVPAEPARGSRVRLDARLVGRFSLPLAGVSPPDDLDLLPGAPRDYRAGIHEGIDFPAPAGTPVLAAAAGEVIRADASFLDWSREQQEIALFQAFGLGYTPAATLDRVRGRQVWIDHGGGVVTRYAHLSEVADIAVGQRVTAGAVIGAVGSSGYPQGGPHLHFEVRVGDDYVGDGLGGDALRLLVSRLFL